MASAVIDVFLLQLQISTKFFFSKSHPQPQVYSQNILNFFSNFNLDVLIKYILVKKSVGEDLI